MKFLFLILFCIHFGNGQESCEIPENERVDCYPETFGSVDDPALMETMCLRRGCRWCPSVSPVEGFPSCHLPKEYGYRVVGDPIENDQGVQVNLEKIPGINLYPRDSPQLLLEAQFQSNYRLRIKITDGTPRWEVPLEITESPNPPDANRLYDIVIERDPVFSFKVIRRSTGTILFDTSLGGFTFSDQFLQMGVALPSKNVYGLGEHEHRSFRHSFEGYTTWPIFARGDPPNYTRNLYGAQPYLTVIDDNDGNTFSMAFVNSNAQEFTMMPNPGFVYRTIGGIFDIYFFLGPDPEDTSRQYTEAVGRLNLPPYWALGFQLSKYGYNTLDNMKEAVDRTLAAGIPQDVQYGDIDIMDRALDFTYHKERFAGLPEYIKELKEEKGIKFVTILDPVISIGEPPGSYKPFELGQEMDVWVKKSDGTPLGGLMWPEDICYWPDYSSEATHAWWRELIVEFKQLLDFDALWIDMNEPDNFANGDPETGCNINKWNAPPYTPKITGSYIYSLSLCMDAVDSNGKHYDTHNLYGWFEGKPTYDAVLQATGKRAFVLSRSTFLGSGKWTSHWLGDNYSLWSNLHYSIIGMLQFNQFGIPMVGSDVCGFFNDTTPEMCERWTQLGAFYPFFRNHNFLGQADQDPGVFPVEVQESMRNVINIRYELLPYLYELFYYHNLFGDTVIRPLWAVFPQDGETYGIDKQFLWGKGLMISPVLEEGATSVSAYFPAKRIFSFYDGIEVEEKGAWVTLDAPRNFIPLHVVGGNILPRQDPAMNTGLARKNPFGLIVALDEDSYAYGILFWDDGESQDTIQNNEYYQAQFTMSRSELDDNILILKSNPAPHSLMDGLLMETIRIFGVERQVAQVLVNGVDHTEFQDDSQVFITNLGLEMNQEFNIELHLITN